jgi:hypothetical protein
MKRTRHSAAKIVKKLHGAAMAWAGGKIVEEARQGLGISKATYPRSQKGCDGADVEAVRERSAL